MKKIRILGLIPTRLNSERLPQKALMEIEKIPLIIHTYKRAKMSKKLDDVFICCDDEKVLHIAKKFNAKAILTSKNHENGTERICEGYLSLKKKYDYIVDIQGDEPLLSPMHIDQVIDAHLKFNNADIILPTLQIEPTNNTNIIKVVTTMSNKVLYLSRANIPLEFKSKKNYIKKHLSIISFKPEALKKFSMSKKSYMEKIEDVELLRALEIGLNIQSINLKGDSFSVDVYEDYKNAKKYMKSDRYFKIYK